MKDEKWAGWKQISRMETVLGGDIGNVNEWGRKTMIIFFPHVGSHRVCVRVLCVSVWVSVCVCVCVCVCMIMIMITMRGTRSGSDWYPTQTAKRSRQSLSKQIKNFAHIISCLYNAQLPALGSMPQEHLGCGKVKSSVFLGNMGVGVCVYVWVFACVWACVCSTISILSWI